jgi:hypothetical protein
MLDLNSNSQFNYPSISLPTLESIVKTKNNFCFVTSLFNPEEPGRLSRVTLPIIENFSLPERKSEENIKSLPRTLVESLDFELELKSQIEKPVLKGKYFAFKVILKELKSFRFPANEKLEIEVEVFTLDNVLISNNMRGNQILRGNFIQYMNYYKPEACHIAYFKIQITEVSSHYVGKKINLKVKARFSEFLQATGWKVKPIVVNDLIVKAKKSS